MKRPILATIVKDFIVMIAHMQKNKRNDMIIIRLLFKRRPKRKQTLKMFVMRLKALNEIYGNDSPELAVAIGRFFDNHCRR